MTIFGSNNRRYGDLAQTNTFRDNACAPTSFANALFALGFDELMVQYNESNQATSLLATRDTLGKDYFFTSPDWLGDRDGYIIAGGTVPSQLIGGGIKYIAERNLSDQVTLTASGLVRGEVNDKKFDYTGFDYKKKITFDNVTRLRITPKREDIEPYFHEIKPGDSRGVLDSLITGLSRGPVLLALYYTNGRGGHALLGTQLELNDTNSNGILEKDENHYIYFVDPLNPGYTYSPSLGYSITKDQFANLKTVTGPYITQGHIWQNENGFLSIEYDQKSLTDINGTLILADGDSSNNTNKINATGDITLLASLSTSGLPPNFDSRAGALAQSTPGMIDFSFLTSDPNTKDKSLKGHIYSNESSGYSNNFLFYECLDASGKVAIQDPVTGAFTEFLPTDAGYNDAVWNLANSFTNGDAFKINQRKSLDQQTIDSLTIDISELGTGYLAPITRTSAGDLWSVYTNANSDGMQHYQSEGNLSWGMEDLPGLGDQDFNDLHVSMIVGSII